MTRKFSKPTLFVMSMLMCAAFDTTAAQAQDVWGAIAFNARGAIGSAWNRPSQGRAERDAMRKCNEVATRPCKVLSGANAACGVVSIGTRGRTRSAFAVIRPGLSQARTAAMNRCIGRGYSQCRIRGFMCADGSHK